jgi:hypothetical protein
MNERQDFDHVCRVDYVAVRSKLKHEKKHEPYASAETVKRATPSWSPREASFN